jgi:hypothetical protein
LGVELTTLLCIKLLLQNPKEVKTGSNLVQNGCFANDDDDAMKL